MPAGGEATFDVQGRLLRAPKLFLLKPALGGTSRFERVGSNFMRGWWWLMPPLLPPPLTQMAL